MTAAGGTDAGEAPLLASPPASRAPRVRATTPLVVILAIAALLTVIVAFRACA